MSDRLEALCSRLTADQGLFPNPGLAVGGGERGETVGQDRRFQVDGEAMLTLSDAFGNGQVDARFDRSVFERSFGLMHHTVSTETACFLVVSSSGLARPVFPERP